MLTPLITVPAHYARVGWDYIKTGSANSYGWVARHSSTSAQAVNHFFQTRIRQDLWEARIKAPTQALTNRVNTFLKVDDNKLQWEWQETAILVSGIGLGVLGGVAIVGALGVGALAIAGFVTTAVGLGALIYAHGRVRKRRLKQTFNVLQDLRKNDVQGKTKDQISKDTLLRKISQVDTGLQKEDQEVKEKVKTLRKSAKHMEKASRRRQHDHQKEICINHFKALKQAVQTDAVDIAQAVDELGAEINKIWTRHQNFQTLQAKFNALLPHSNRSHAIGTTLNHLRDALKELIEKVASKAEYTEERRKFVSEIRGLQKSLRCGDLSDSEPDNY